MSIDINQLKYLNSLPNLLQTDQYFQQETNIENLRVEVNKAFSESLIYKILNFLNEEGYLILFRKEKIFSIHEVIELQTYFGELLDQTNQIDSKVYSVESMQNSIKFIQSNLAQPLHTDGNFKLKPPQIVALHCEINSELGGYSKLVKAINIYKYICRISSSLGKLVCEELVTCERKDRNYSEPRMHCYSRPIFFRMENGNLGISYNPLMYKVSSSKKIEQLYQLISYFSNNPKNQITFRLKPGEILLLDNTAMLHGRSGFPCNQVRKLNRLWFDGNQNSLLNLGFQP